MFAGCKQLKTINLPKLETKENINMCYIFNGYKDLTIVIYQISLLLMT